MNDRRGAASAIGWTLLSILVPGAAHLRAGHRVVGFGLLALFLGTAALASGLVAASGGLAVLTQSSWTKAVAGWAIGVGVAWALLVVISYVTLRPRRMLLWSDAVALVLVGAVLSPFVLASQAVSEVDNTLGDVFTAPEEPAPIDHADPWAGRTRINILLLGGDGASTRAGESIRTDSINVASIDVKTGDTVMFALPRELENTPFPQGSVMRRLFPPPKNFYMEGPERGNSDLLNSVWEYADTHPEYFRDSSTRAPDAVMGAVGEILGLKIDYYVLVNMWGVARLIDALGGVRVHVTQDICYGVGRADGGVIRAGTHRLDGNDALWFGRARDHDGSTCAGGDNHTRMKRQQCVISSMLDQLDPSTVLFKFQQLAKAARETFMTDIPRGRLQDLVPLADLVKQAHVTTLSFVPPAYDPAWPDFPRIRADVRKALAAPPAVRPRPHHTAVSATARLSDACSV